MPAHVFRDIRAGKAGDVLKKILRDEYEKDQDDDGYDEGSHDHDRERFHEIIQHPFKFVQDAKSTTSPMRCGAFGY